MMTLYGFFNATTGAWLDNDFQWPHFPDIHALIAARFAGDADAFAAQHGDPAQWSRRAIEETQMRDIITPAVPTLYATLTISGGDGKRPPCLRLGKASQKVQILLRTIDIDRREFAIWGEPPRYSLLSGEPASANYFQRMYGCQWGHAPHRPHSSGRDQHLQRFPAFRIWNANRQHCQ